MDKICTEPGQNYFSENTSGSYHNRMVNFMTEYLCWSKHFLFTNSVILLFLSASFETLPWETENNKKAWQVKTHTIEQEIDKMVKYRSSVLTFLSKNTVEDNQQTPDHPFCFVL